MTDVRFYRQKQALDVEDKDFIFKLLSKLEIVKWSLPFEIPFGNEEECLKQIREYTRNSSSKKDGDAIERWQALESTFPTQVWDENGVRKAQRISDKTGSRMDAAKLRAAIKDCAILAQARVTGVCPIRENLIFRCFNEMIRVAIIDDVRRGLLLRDIRDELRMSLTCWKTLVKHAIQNKTLSYEKTMNSVQGLRDEVEELKFIKESWRHRNQDMKIEMSLMDREFEEQETAIEEYRKIKLTMLKKTCEQFIALLDAVGADKSQYRHLL